MNEIKVRFTNGEILTFPTKVDYFVGKKIINIMNRKLTNQFKEEYKSVAYVVNDRDQVLFVNYKY